MISYYSAHWRRNLPWLLAAVALGFLPAAADAAVLAFRNDTDSPILVQGITIINRVVRKGKLHALRPGEVSRELILVPGNRVIIVADARQPTRILCEEAIQFTGEDLFIAIQTEEPPKSKEANKTSAKAKVKLVVLPKPVPPVSPPPAPRR